MSLKELDPILTMPKKLAAIGMLASSAKVEFAFIRDHLELSDSDLSKQMKTLVDAEYVKVKKTGRGRDRQTWYSITKAGDRALRSHIDALRALVVETLPPSSAPSS